jgi:hypothetical protein
MRRALFMAASLATLAVQPVVAASPDAGCAPPFARWSIVDMREVIFNFPAGSLEVIDLNRNGYLCVRHHPTRAVQLIIDDRAPALR